MHLDKGDFQVCMADCDVAVARGRELRADHVIISMALTLKAEALRKLNLRKRQWISISRPSMSTGAVPARFSCSVRKIPFTVQQAPNCSCDGQTTRCLDHIRAHFLAGVKFGSWVSAYCLRNNKFQQIILSMANLKDILQPVLQFSNSCFQFQRPFGAPSCNS